MSKTATPSPQRRGRKPEQSGSRSLPASRDEASSERSSASSRALASRWLIGIVVAGLIAEVAIVLWLRHRVPADSPPLPAEVAIGTFEFNRSSSRDSRLYHGQFDVSLRPADLDNNQRAAVREAQRRFPKAVEEAIRRVRAADFLDPHLTRLTDRIMRQLNEELGFDGIEEVMISNFAIQAKPMPAGPTASTED